MTLPDRELTEERVAIILDHLHRSPKSESGIKAIWNAFPVPRPALNAVTDWVQVLLQRGLVRITRHADGRPLYGPVDFDTLLEPDDVDDTLRRPILAVLAEGPAMAGRIAERLDVPVRFVQATTLVMWREGELISSPVGAGFVLRSVQPMTADEAAATLRTWAAERQPAQQEQAASTPSLPDAAPPIPLPRLGTMAARLLERFKEPRTVDDARSTLDIDRVAAVSLVQQHLRGGNLQIAGQQGRFKFYQLVESRADDLAPFVPTYLGDAIPPAPDGIGWTQARLEWLKTAYPLLGSRACAARLGMTESPVQRRVRELDLRYGEIPNYIGSVELSDMLGISPEAIRDAARRARVLTYIGTSDRPGNVVVPLEWADSRAERASLPDEDDVALTDITQDQQALNRIRERFRRHMYLRTPMGRRAQMYVSRKVADEIRATLQAPVKKGEVTLDDVLPWLEAAGPNGLTLIELEERSGLSQGVCYNHLQRGLKLDVLERFTWDDHRSSHVYRMTTYRTAPRPTERDGYKQATVQLEGLLAAAGPRGVTLHEALEQLPGLQVRSLEHRLERMMRAGQVTRSPGSWATPSVYHAAGVTPDPDGARALRTDDADVAVAQAILELDTGSGVNGEQIAMHLRQSYYQVTLTIQRLQTLRVLKTRKEGREVIYEPLPTLGHVKTKRRAPRQAPQQRPRVAPQPPPAPTPAPPTQEIPMTPPPTTSPSPAPAIVPTSLVQQLAALEEQARPLEQLQTDLVDLDQRRQILVTRIADAQSARDVLTRITQSISSVLNPAAADPVSEPVRPAVHVEPTPVVATPAPQASPDASGDDADPERRRALFPAPIPDGLTPEELRVFKLVREVKEGLPFKQIVARLNMPSDQASKAIDGLIASGHLRKSGSHYRAHAQAQAA